MTSLPRAVLITGATSGIGQASALRLASRGRRLLLAGRSEEQLASMHERCIQLGAADVATCAGDLSERPCIDELVKSAEVFGDIGAFVNCAGIGRFGPTVEFSHDDWCDVISLNLTGAFLLCKLMIPLLTKENETATIVNVSSDADLEGFAEAAAYCASKGGLLAMTRALRKEFQKDRLRICTVSPGRVDTHFNNKKPGMRPGALSADDVAEVVEFAVCCGPQIEIHEIRLDSLSRKDS